MEKWKLGGFRSQRTKRPALGETREHPCSRSLVRAMGRNSMGKLISPTPISSIAAVKTGRVEVMTEALPHLNRQLANMPCRRRTQKALAGLYSTG